MNKRTAANAWLAMSVSVVVLLGMGAVAGGGDPLVGVHYEVAAEGVLQGYFTELDGIGSENEVVENKLVSKTGQEIIQKIPGRLKFLDVTLKRGITTTPDLWAWRSLVETGKIEDARKNVSIILYTQDQQPVAEWGLVNAWPSKIVQSTPATATGVGAVEELTLVNEGYTRIR